MVSYSLHPPTPRSKEWVNHARDDLSELRTIVSHIFTILKTRNSALGNTIGSLSQVRYWTEKMLKYNTKLKQYIPYIQSYLTQQLVHQTYVEAINTNQSQIAKKLYALQLLDEELITELKTFPYTRPETVRDPLAPILTTHSHTANSISTAHLYPAEPIPDSTQPGTAMGMGDEDEGRHANQRSKNGVSFKTPTVPLDTLLYLARQYQFYRAGPNLPPDLRRHNRSYPPQLLHTGLLVKPVEHLLNDMGSFAL